MTADPARVWALAVLDAAGVDVGPADVGKAAEVVRLMVEDAELRARADAALGAKAAADREELALLRGVEAPLAEEPAEGLEADGGTVRFDVLRRDEGDQRGLGVAV